MTPLQALIDARALIAEPERWTQGAFARTGNGHSCNDSAAEASCWCIDGAIGVASRNGGDWDSYSAATGSLMVTLGVTSIVKWNDAAERTHAEVLAAFDAAIARLQEHAE